MSEHLRCLDESEPYARLRKRKESIRKVRRFALAPIAVVMFVVVVIFRDPSGDRWQLPIVVAVGLALAWTLLVVGYDLVLNVRTLTATCPRCNRRFGGDDSCFYCDLPRQIGR